MYWKGLGLIHVVRWKKDFWLTKIFTISLNLMNDRKKNGPFLPRMRTNIWTSTRISTPEAANFQIHKLNATQNAADRIDDVHITLAASIFKSRWKLTTSARRWHIRSRYNNRQLWKIDSELCKSTNVSEGLSMYVIFIQIRSTIQHSATAAIAKATKL